MRVAPDDRRSDGQFVATVALLLMALLFGGGQGTLGDSATQLLAVGLIAWLIVRRQRLAPLPLWTWLPLLAMVAIPLLQLLPLPADTWSALGARAEIGAQLAMAGVEADTRVGLDPLGSERALAWLLPGIAMYLSVLRLPRRQQSRLVFVLLCFAAASVVLGLAQLAGGRESALRFYEHTNPGGMVGFFANRNHAATLLALCLPLAMAFAACAVIERSDGRAHALLRIVAGAGLLVLLMLGLAMTQSRAGLLVGMFAMLMTCPLLLGLQRDHGLRRVLIGSGVLAGVLVAQFALLGILQSFGADPLGESRRGYIAPTLQAAAAYAPTGSGLGTFRQVYQPFERESPAGADNVIINHAHNDYLELWVEAGWLVIPCGLLLLGVLAFAALRMASRSDHRSVTDLLWQRVAMIALLVPLVHSLFDYPLRTTAHVAGLGMLAGILVSGVARKRRILSGQDLAQPEL